MKHRVVPALDFTSQRDSNLSPHEGHVAKSCEMLDAPLAESTNTAAV